MSTVVPLCNLGTLAKLFVLSERRVQQLRASGIIPKAQDGQYHLVNAVNAYILFLRERARLNDHPSAEAALIAQQRLRLLKARADRAEHDNQVVEGQWLNASEVNQAFQEVGAVFIACVDALPGRLAFELAGIDDPAVIKAKLFEACRHLRHSTGDCLHALGATLRERDTLSAADSSTAAPDAGSVGGQPKASAIGKC